MRGGSFSSRFGPWAGLAIGVLTVAIVHQFGSDGVFDDCRQNAPGPLLIVAAIGLLICLLSGLASWRSSRNDADEARRVVGLVSTGSAALFGFAILLAMIAAIVLPPCFQ
jgi:membrane associated rhomboid family serine protease